MKKGDLIYTPFPFTDLTTSKIRPALLLYSGNEDVLVAYITSKGAGLDENLTVILQPDKENNLRKQSFIRIEKLATIDKSIVWGILGTISSKALQEVIHKLTILISK